MKLPNVRKMFVPDSGYVIGDADLDRADLQVVVWEADDADLKAKLREGADMHQENANDLNCSRDMAKRFVHGTNYGGSSRTMAISCGISVHQSDAMQKRWFSAHPGIKAWHDRTMQNLMTKREVRNAFGFRRFYFDRIEGVLPQALAWIPQSTVANVINMGLRNLWDKVPQVELLLQVHDSLVFQYEKRFDPWLRKRIQEALLITVPYPDPLIIPVGLKLSDSSWGECKAVDW